MSKSRPWYETFFDGLFGEVLTSDVHEGRALEQARMVRRLLRLRRGQRVLDCPCGAGRLTVPLAKMGLKLTGVDLTASYVAKARRQARKEGLNVRLIRQDMREIDFDGEFHAVINWFSSFGYFDEAGDLATAKAALKALKPGGRFLIDVVNRSWLLAHVRPHHEEQVGPVRIIQKARWDAKLSRIVSVWTFQKGRRVERHRIFQRLYNGADMRKLLHAAGFREIEFHGWPPLGRLTRHSRRLIAIAKRPKE